MCACVHVFMYLGTGRLPSPPFFTQLFVFPFPIQPLAVGGAIGHRAAPVGVRRSGGGIELALGTGSGARDPGSGVELALGSGLGGQG